MNEIDSAEYLIVATGSEVNIALDVAEDLAKENVKVAIVSMPSMEIFEKQSEEYKKSVFPPSISKRVSIEAGVSQGWHKFVGIDGLTISINEFGKSAPAEELFADYGFSTKAIIEKIKKHFN